MHKMWWKNYFQALFFKMKIDHISGLSFIQFVFVVCQVEDYRNMLKLSCRPLVFISYKTLLINKKILGTTVSLPHIPQDFLRLIFLLLYSIN